MARKKTVKIVENKEAKILKDQTGNEHLVVVEDKTFYSFTNKRKGPMFFKREDGKEDWFEGKETKNDITERERLMLLKSGEYRLGYLEEVSDQEEITNINSITQKQLDCLINENKNDLNGLKKFIDKMDSDFAIKELKEELIKRDLPSSVVLFCDYKLKQMEEAYMESQKAPIDREDKELQ